MKPSNFLSLTKVWRIVLMWCTLCSGPNMSPVAHSKDLEKAVSPKHTKQKNWPSWFKKIYISNFGSIFIFFCCHFIILGVFTKEKMGLQLRFEIIRGTVWTALLSSCRPVLIFFQCVLYYLCYSSFWAPSRSSVYLIIWGYF